MSMSCAPLARATSLACLLAGGAGVPAHAIQSAPTPPRVPTAPVPPVRIMPLGDSITHGGQGHAGWRYPLWFLLNGAAPIDFVGSQSTCFPADTVNNPNPAFYPDYYTTFDRDHEGRWARRTDQIEALIYAACLGSRPDITLIHLGTNDIGQYAAAGIANAQANLPLVISHIRAVRPASVFLIAKIIPIGPGNRYWVMAQHVAPLNAMYEQLALAESTPASPVLTVDLNTGYDLANDMQVDGLHPDVSGEERMAAAWMPAVLAQLGGHRPPSHPSAQVIDPGFEALVLTDGQSSEWPAGIAWHFGATPGMSFGLFNPPRDSYTNALGDGTPIGGEGADAVYLQDDGSGSESAVVYQTLATTLEAGSTYTLTIAVGRRLFDNSYGPTTYGGFRVELMAGNDVIASAVDTILPTPGTFQDVTVSVASASVPARLLGQALTVRAGMTATAALSATDFDNVRLTVQ